jgi:hypothetical protein
MIALEVENIMLRIVLILITSSVAGLILEQMLCFLGVPNCD